MIELLTIGTELLLGSTIDTNGAWLGTRLAQAGLRVTRRTTVPDDADAIRDALRAALQRSGTVVCTGGLGPTADDFTKPVVAALYGRALVLDEDWLEHVRARFRSRGLEMPPVNANQALLPNGARIFPNARGTAPGLALEDDALGTTVLLPGVPSEMRALAEEQVLPWLVARFGTPRPIASRTLRTTGIAESAIQERLADILDTGLPPAPPAEPQQGAAAGPTLAPNVGHGAPERAVPRTAPAEPASRVPVLRGLPLALAFLPTGIGEDLRLTCWGELEGEAARAALDAGERLLRERVGEWVYGRDAEDLAEVVGQLLHRHGLTLAVAESCTGGLIAQRITAVPGASSYFLGGFIVYANTLKQKLVGVRAETLAAHGAVSEPVALELARGAAAAAGADCAIAVTGIAGPDGGTPEKPVGTVWIGVVSPGQAKTKRYSFGGSRTEIRARAAQAALAMLLHQLERARVGA